MTENKRFNIKPSAIFDDVTVIVDSEKKYSFTVLDNTLNYMFCKALNELNDENKELKQTIKRLNSNIDELLDISVAEDLLKENKELKKRNENLLAKLKFTCEQINYSEKLREMLK